MTVLEDPWIGSGDEGFELLEENTRGMDARSVGNVVELLEGEGPGVGDVILTAGGRKTAAVSSGLGRSGAAGDSRRVDAFPNMNGFSPRGSRRSLSRGVG